ncbi:hypothetical protein KRR26_05650 [Corallococcus sp. M34]|uniref:hypothetical protein n=1 Tax=Citreicoccus inhibens TaxID=2849499 RepID=UPI001C24413D|nr:hypothetical protein [Citreicoccus inhibens]MBU8895077.1 hypothetical protein [Citreicoccus inhibens]
MTPAPALPCPRCGAARAQSPECPRCGVIYAKADARARQEASAREAEDQRRALREVREALPPPPTFTPLLAELRPPENTEAPGPDDAEVALARLEWHQRFWVLPVTMGLAYVVMGTGFRGLARIFLSMHVHEFGHAVTAWFCGFSAMPSLWVTYTAESRSPVLSLMFAGMFGALGWRGWKTGRKSWMAWAAALLLIQAVATLGTTPQQARALITFGGDAGCLVLGALLMSLFYARRGTALHERGLRWGLLVMGAIAFMDSLHTWWGARKDVDRIPFGDIEGVGLSDPSKLVDQHGWSVGTLIDRHVGVATACLVLLGALYLYRLYEIRTAAPRLRDFRT